MADPRLGKVLQGRYRILSLLAEGGMGLVYKGERVGIGRAVVVKFLHAVLSDKPGIVDRFEREARATARLNHPHCVALVDFGIDDSAPYLVMEYVEGKTLADLLDHGAVPSERAIHIVRQILAGLEHAHERGILHRDLKPANVMIVHAEGFPGDFVKILDFGLAKLAWPGEDKRDVTVEGIAIGTPGYMSPEQAAGVPSDRRADIYCAGALLYHLVTGSKAFEGDDVRSVLRRHREQTPAAPRAIKPEMGISTELEEVLMRALQRDPAKRFQNAQEMSAALMKTPEAKRKPSTSGGAAMERLPGVPSLPSSSDDATRAEAPSAKARARGGRRGAWLVVGLIVGAGGAGAAMVYSPLADYLPSLKKHAESVRPPPTPTASHKAKNVETPPVPVHKVVPDMTAPIVPDMTPPPPPSVANADEDEDEPAADDGSNENDRAPPPEPAAAPRRESSIRHLSDAKSLVKKGDADGALAGLYRLRSSKPAPNAAKSSEIATLIGHLYFDKKWWTDALREYRFAIATDGKARRNEALVNNSVHALAERTTYPRARRLILDYVGRNATPALKRAAKSGATPQLRRRAQKLLALLESKSYRTRH
jgi:eukaryotic-like serine/threonine-protein kinase